MSQTQESEIGKSMLMSLPTEAADMILAYHECPTEEQKEYVRNLSDVFEGKPCYWTKKTAELSLDDPDLYYTKWYCKWTDTTVLFPHQIGSHWTEDLGRDINTAVQRSDPLHRTWFFRKGFDVLDPPLDAAGQRLDLRRLCGERGYWVRTSYWVTPHLAGLPKEHDNRFMTAFQYDQDERTYELVSVRRIRETEGMHRMEEILPYRLIFAFTNELFCKRRVGRSEGDEFLEFVKHYLRSSDKKDERLQRAATRLYGDFKVRKVAKQGAKPIPSV